jgi:hypothetical protein
VANVSHRLGNQSSPEAIRAPITGYTEIADAFERCRAHLRGNGVDLAAAPATVGALVSSGAKHGCFVADFADAFCLRLQAQPTASVGTVPLPIHGSDFVDLIDY